MTQQKEEETTLTRPGNGSCPPLVDSLEPSQKPRILSLLIEQCLIKPVPSRHGTSVSSRLQKKIFTTMGTSVTFLPPADTTGDRIHLSSCLFFSPWATATRTPRSTKRLLLALCDFDKRPLSLKPWKVGAARIQ